MNQTEQVILRLIASALWNVTMDDLVLSADEWVKLYELSVVHGVSPFVFSGASAYKKAMPADLMNKWRSSVIATVVNNDRMLNAQDKLLGLLAAHDIPCAIIKGSSLSVNYPQPEMRPLGDIDLLIRPEDAERTEKLLTENGYQPDHTGHPFHLDFFGKGAVVEMHWAVTSFPEMPGAQVARQVMSDALNDVDTARVEGHSFSVLRPAYQALTLLLHMERHMISSGIGLRQLCDWMMFIAAMGAEKFRTEVMPELEKCGVLQFAEVLTAACVRYLGMPQDRVPWCAQVQPVLSDAMLEEILRGGNMGKADENNGASAMFVDRQGYAQKQNVLQVTLRQLTTLAKKHFPIVERVPLLLPVFWVYIPVRYAVRMLLGKRKWLSATEVLTSAQKRRGLYDQLNIFDVEHER